MHAHSASSFIRNSETGEELRGQGGQRLYFVVEDGRDIPRAMGVLAQRLWLAGHGWIAVSGSGSKLDRTLFDTSVWQPERLDFVGGADCTPPLEQRRPKPSIFDAETGNGRVDTRVVFPDLTVAEMTRYRRLIGEAKRKVQPKADRAYEAWRIARGEEAVGRARSRGEEKGRELSVEDERTAYERGYDAAGRAVSGELTGDFQVVVLPAGEGGERVVVTVAEILADPEVYDGMLTLDPLEPDYKNDKVVGKLHTVGTKIGKPVLVSMAHGKRTYRLARQDISEAMAELSSKLGQKFSAERDDKLIASTTKTTFEIEFLAITSRWEGGPQGEAAQVLLEMCERYVMFPGSTSNERVCSLNNLGERYSKDGFRDLYPDMAEVLPPPDKPEGKPKPVKIAAAWLNSGLPMRIAGYRYVPDTEDRLVEEEDGQGEARLWLNTYHPPRLGQYREENERLWEELLGHLFDRANERKLFENWLAYKFQNPKSRGTFTILVSPKIEGTGRGTLFQLLSGAFGVQNCELGVPSSKIVGKGSSAEFNDWMCDRLFATIDELSTVSSGFGGRSRTELTEKVKTLFEVDPKQMRFNPKYGQQRSEMCYLSTVAATNEENALVLDPQTDNRRFAVYSTGAKGTLMDNPKLAAKLEKVRMNDWTCSDMSATIVHRYSLENWGPADPETFRMSVMTPAKEKMIAATKAPSLELIEETLKELEKEGRIYIELGDLEKRCARLAERDGRREIGRFVRNDFGAFSSNAGFAGWVRVEGASGSDRLNATTDGVKRKVRVLACGQKAAEAFLGMTQEYRGAALKGGSGTDADRANKIGSLSQLGPRGS